MKMTHEQGSLDGLADDPVDALLQAARRTPPAPSDDFMARVLDDALAMQPQTAVPPARGPAPPRRLLARALAALGGGLGVAGLGSAAMAGLVIGYVQPDPLLMLTDRFGVTADAASPLELLPGFDTLLTEDIAQ